MESFLAHCQDSARVFPEKYPLFTYEKYKKADLPKQVRYGLSD